MSERYAPLRPLLIIVPFSTKSVPWYPILVRGLLMVDEIGTSVPQSRVRFFASGDLNKKGYRFGVTRSVPGTLAVRQGRKQLDVEAPPPKFHLDTPPPPPTLQPQPQPACNDESSIYSNRLTSTDCVINPPWIQIKSVTARRSSIRQSTLAT